MAFSDPISITIGGVANSFARTLVNGRTSQYANAAGDKLFNLSHTVDLKANKSGESHLAKLTYRKLSTNPLLNLPEWVELNTWLVAKQPSFGFTDTEVKDWITALCTSFMTSGNIDKFLGNET